jgi:hypothetical protein
MVHLLAGPPDRLEEINRKYQAPIQWEQEAFLAVYGK